MLQIGKLRLLITNTFIFEIGIFGLKVRQTVNGKGIIIINQN
jgi:hypothetical protein